MSRNAVGTPTIPCPVRLGLDDGRSLDAVVYLLTDSLRPGGCLSVEATLDGDRDFIPVGLNGTSSLVSRDAIRTVEMAAAGPGIGDLLDIGGSFDVVTLHLDSGEELSGILRTQSPENAARMSDVFNMRGRFLALVVSDRVLLVSKRHLVQATF